MNKTVVDKMVLVVLMDKMALVVFMDKMVPVLDGFHCT
jgi:hypothetical protein